MPANPQSNYKDKGWVSWGDWLGTNRIATKDIKYRSFSKARAFTRKLNLKNSEEWHEFCKSGDKPSDIPTNAHKTYKNSGWVSMGDWLGTGTVATRHQEFRSFEESRKFIRSLKLNSQKEWNVYRNSGDKPSDIPANPQQLYKDDGWKGFGDWLGTGVVATRLRKYRSFKEARKFARSLNLKSRAEWVEFCKSGNMPDDIPNYPNQVYEAKGWKSMGDWLGTGIVAPRLRKYRSFKDARKFVHALKLEE